ncbi:cystathionine gamma-synthase [Paraferrimonas sp. SM1919]|uniref:cystathionine gamma-synthase n=1 Tax=Paraferrimonas sp. SM1919 TaxID=2662263 RepID=UPI0013D46AAF|nr:cystathionine gamma-synthase [Paraferrimonas sp. SM1919]
MSNRKVATHAVRQGLESDSQFGAVVPPIYLSTNYIFDDYRDPPQYDYGRGGNPTRNAVADAINKLEGGAGAVMTSSGLASITLVVSLLKSDDLLVIPHDCYGGSYRLFTNLANKGHFKLAVVDQTNEQQLRAVFKDRPAMVWLETPSNPLLRIVDIGAICQQAKAVDAKVVVDNTFLSPFGQQPLQLGADIVIHSTTKYINGHSDVIGGVAIANTEQLAEELSWWANTLGLTGSPFDGYLTLRGLRTLGPRIRQHTENAQILVETLVNHPAVTKVYYPGLEDHPQHQLAKRQQNNFGAMISFELIGGEDEVATLVGNLNEFCLAESLGGVESLVCVPATMTHRAMAPEARLEAGVKDTLIRLSVGIEDSQDLTADLTHALDKVLETNK